MSQYELESLRNDLHEARLMERKAIADFLNAEKAARTAKVAWEDARFIGLASHTIAGKNPDEREGNARLQYEPEYSRYRETEITALEAKSFLEACRSRVDELRDTLRTFEVVSGIKAVV